MSVSIYQSQTNPADGNSPYQDGVAASGTNVYYSASWSGQHAIGTSSIQTMTTGTLTGTFEHWVSNKPIPNMANDNDWTKTLTTLVNPAGAATNAITNGSIPGAHWQRLKYTNASGTGNLFSYISVPISR